MTLQRDPPDTDQQGASEANDLPKVSLEDRLVLSMNCPVPPSLKVFLALEPKKSLLWSGPQTPLPVSEGLAVAQVEVARSPSR